MNRQRLDHLLQQVQQIQRQQAPGVSLIVPAEDGTYHLIVTSQRGQRRESVHQTRDAAHAVYQQMHHATDHTLIIVDV